jgi:transposase InsO family protein
MHQAALALAGFDDSPLKGATQLLMDRDTKYTKRFREVLQENGVEPVLLPPRSPNLNAQAERFVRSIKSECLAHLIFFGTATLVHAIREYAAHYNGERNHQGLGNRLPTETPTIGRGRVLKRGRLGGLLNDYHRRVA